MVLFKSGIKGCLNDVSRFTFHYGPIQIFIVRIKSFVPTIFTFHYGPIQIDKPPVFSINWNGFTFHYGPIQM